MPSPRRELTRAEDTRHVTGEEAEGRSELEAGLTLEAVLEQPIPPRQKDEDEVFWRGRHCTPQVRSSVHLSSHWHVCLSVHHPSIH